MLGHLCGIIKKQQQQPVETNPIQFTAAFVAKYTTRSDGQSTLPLAFFFMYAHYFDLENIFFSSVHPYVCRSEPLFFPLPMPKEFTAVAAAAAHIQQQLNTWRRRRSGGGSHNSWEKEGTDRYRAAVAAVATLHNSGRRSKREKEDKKRISRLMMMGLSRSGCCCSSSVNKSLLLFCE